MRITRYGLERLYNVRGATRNGLVEGDKLRVLGLAGGSPCD